MTFKKKSKGTCYEAHKTRITMPLPPKNYYSTRSPQRKGKVVQVKDKRIARCEQ